MANPYNVALQLDDINMPIALSDSELDSVFDAARPLQPPRLDYVPSARPGNLKQNAISRRVVVERSETCPPGEQV
jgi:hypothetical protein